MGVSSSRINVDSSETAAADVTGGGAGTAPANAMASMAGDFARAASDGSATKAYVKSPAGAVADSPCGAAVAAVTDIDRSAGNPPMATRNLTPVERRTTCKHK